MGFVKRWNRRFGNVAVATGMLPRKKLARTNYGSQIVNPYKRRLAKALSKTSLRQRVSGLGGVLSKVVSNMNSELKASDSNPALYNTLLPLTTTAPFALLNGVGQGSGEGDRIGNQITIKSIQGRITFNNPLNASQLVRFIIVRDMQCNGAFGDLGSLLENATLLQSPLNIINGNAESRYSILYDKMLNLSGIAQGDLIHKKFYMKTDITCKYIGTGATVASCGQNAIYAFAVSSTDGSDPSFVTTFAYFRIRYTDS